MAAGELFFCIDGGGTRSRGRLLDGEGGILAEAVAGPCNPGTNMPWALESAASLWRHCCGAVGRDEEQREEVVLAMGAAGAYMEGGAKFLEAFPRFGRNCLISDGYAALIGAGGGVPASLIIIGTGVAGHRLFANGVSIQRDAWGWLAGDRGSASYIGQKALRHYLATLDGVAPQDGLSRAVSEAIGGVEALRSGWMRDLGALRFGSLAPVVLAQAEAGDPMAVRIRDRAVDHLVALIGVIADADTPLYAAGGLVAPLKALISREISIPILEPRSDAITGCWLVASGRAPHERALLFGDTLEPSP
jgi:glucosamine kinase